MGPSAPSTKIEPAEIAQSEKNTSAMPSDGSGMNVAPPSVLRRMWSRGSSPTTQTSPVLGSSKTSPKAAEIVTVTAVNAPTPPAVLRCTVMPGNEIVATQTLLPRAAMLMPLPRPIPPEPVSTVGGAQVAPPSVLRVNDGLPEKLATTAYTVPVAPPTRATSSPATPRSVGALQVVPPLVLATTNTRRESQVKAA